MSEQSKSLGEAIDEVIAALEPLGESSRLTAVKAACEHLGLSGLPFDGNSTTTTEEKEAILQRAEQAETGARNPPQDIRTLTDQKKPATVLEMACIVAYYLSTLAPPDERKTEITKADLEKYFVQANYPLPSRMQQVPVDAKAAGYLDSPGRGRYKLNPVGHNLVVHSLPRTKSE